MIKTNFLSEYIQQKCASSLLVYLLNLKRITICIKNNFKVLNRTRTVFGDENGRRQGKKIDFC